MEGGKAKVKGGGSKRKHEDDAPAEAPYNPLRDRDLLSAASQTVATSLLRDERKVTAMAFCVEVLESIGMHEFAIGQAERISISTFRKAALGSRDAECIVKPEPAAPVIVPPLTNIAASLGSELPRAKDQPMSDVLRRLDQLDPQKLRSESLVHLEHFYSDQAAAIAMELAEGAAKSNQATALRESSGTGRCGAYGDVALTKSGRLRILRDALQSTLRRKLQCDKLAEKVVVTRYGKGGVNYAHRDQSEGGYQAYLLLSRPGLDFTGGDFYIVDPAAEHRRRRVRSSGVRVATSSYSQPTAKRRQKGRHATGSTASARWWRAVRAPRGATYASLVF